MDWAFKARLPPGFDGHEEAYDASLLDWDSFREDFFRVYVKLLFNYQKFMSTRESRAADPNSFKRPFDKEGFLESFTKQEQEFMKEFLKTQAFNNFIDDRLSVDVTADYDALFFDQVRLSMYKDVHMICISVELTSIVHIVH